MNAALATRRMNRGWSIAKLAEKSGVPEYVVRRAERGSKPREDSALKIAQALEAQVTDLWPLPEEAAA